MRRGTGGGKEEEVEDVGDSLENRSSRMPIRSQSSDMGDVVGLVKDMAKFLDRLQYENLSEDSEQVKELSNINTNKFLQSGTKLNVCPHRICSPFVPCKPSQFSGKPGPSSPSSKPACSSTSSFSTTSSVAQLLCLQFPHVHIDGGQQSCRGRR